jgi:hypothetical protein
MKREKHVGVSIYKYINLHFILKITIGKIVQKNAPIKYAEIIEGHSDIELD